MCDHGEECVRAARTSSHRYQRHIQHTTQLPRLHTERRGRWVFFPPWTARPAFSARPRQISGVTPTTIARRNLALRLRNNHTRLCKFAASHHGDDCDEITEGGATKPLSTAPSRRATAAQLQRRKWPLMKRTVARSGSRLAGTGISVRRKG